ncbi:MtrB/PioB family decaheme-associated outer membrane protein [Herbaspirillum sp. ST 5-3]|uniref:MtrB/PioB family decaheme-associated outer membrane protein n=1 Tax=Oxalobacteraceae TaxID=75682 RepID=UPI0010A2EA6F|nr:MtrB/PioB family decaheme-associated outer membrane protein [Herbaspirillum sp. ST 5-3]
MNSNQSSFAVRASVIAVRAALAAFAVLPAVHAAEADNDEVRALTQPSKQVEVGIGYVNHASDKFGEYNGLHKDGAYGIAGFDLRGGGSYDSDNAYRWSVTGRDLGLNTRRLDIDAGEQGRFRFTYTYDELERFYSDQYQTFYDGAGSNALRLPASFAATPAASRVSSTANANAALSNWGNIQSPYATSACAAAALSGGVYGAPTTAACRGPAYLIPAAMHNFDVETQRTKHNLGLSVILAPGWTASASATHELKDGTKLTGVSFGGPGRGGVLVPEPINSSTDQLRASVGYAGEKGHITFGYYGSFYKNSTDVWTVENPLTGNLLNSAFSNNARMIGAPDNEMHRLSLSGGYNFTKLTRLVVNGNYQRMTQNESFLTGLPSSWSVPAASANAKVIDTNINATLTTRPMNNLGLSATYKFEDRDNRTPIRELLVIGTDQAAAPNLIENEPLNRRSNQLILDADYSFARRQAVRFGYEWQEVKRTSTAEENPFKADTTRENTFRLDYRNSVSAAVTGRVGYSHAQRRSSEYEENILLPVPTVPPALAADPLLPGFRMFYLADRNRDQLRSALNFQVSDAFSLQTGVDYNRDDFNNSPYGLKNSNSWVLKLDGAYAASEKLVFNAFYTYEDRKSQLDSLVIGRGNSTTILDAPAHVAGAACTGYFAAAGHLPSDEGTDTCRQWTADQTDKIHTIGFGAKASKLMNGKLDLGFDLAYSYSRTPIDVSGGFYTSNGNPATTAAGGINNVWVAAQSFPDITSNVIDLRLNGTYKVGKASAVRLSYLYRRLRSEDWQYDAYTKSALGALAIPIVPGIGITSPNYAVQAVGVTYIYTFQ